MEIEKNGKNLTLLGHSFLFRYCQHFVTQFQLKSKVSVFYTLFRILVHEMNFNTSIMGSQLNKSYKFSEIWYHKNVFFYDYDYLYLSSIGVDIELFPFWKTSLGS